MKTVLALRNPFGYHRHRPLNSAAGQTLPLVVLFMGVLIAMSGLVIDLGNSYVQKRSTQNVADAAALAAAGPRTPRTVVAMADQNAPAHYNAGATPTLNRCAAESLAAPVPRPP